ncbi:hypothetical protein EV702DRAFT_1201895 [Suillus placidus]|uniref:Protein kinase domain-containing protein n=1 Tax=Suillus placidus TaxID=48579 RepID=A0A9P6ZM58_9AGAM|nr:hypothetical protein EV702DRAFT_1201895 [Suillus placidus]
MERWQQIPVPAPASPSSTSPPSESWDFMRVFRQLVIPPPQNCVASATVKPLSQIELQGSGPSLQELHSLDLDTFHLAEPEHTRMWARETLSHHGPVPNVLIWTAGILRGGILPIRFVEESNVVEYLKFGFMGPAGGGAICLFQISCQPDAAALGFPSAEAGGTAIVSEPNSGQSGRPDMSFIWNANICCTMEVKTHKASTAGSPQVDMLQKLGDDWSQWPKILFQDGSVHLGMVYDILSKKQQQKKERKEETQEDASNGPDLSDVFEHHWQRKVIHTIYQVWNQLVSRESQHGIISNEHTFVLVHRQGHCLQISPSYQYQPADEEERAFTMSDLSFFIAHSVKSRLDQQGKWHGAPSPGPLPVSLAVPQATPGTSRHRLSPSNQPTTSTRGGSVMPNYLYPPIWRWLMSCWRSCSSVQRWRPHNAAPKLSISSSRPNSPPQLIFTTSGCPSFPLQLSPVDKFSWDCSFSTPLVLESLISHTQLPVFRGHLDGSSVVVKMAEDDLCNGLMLEAKIYQDLQPIQGSAVPTCRGVFSGAGAMFLLMDDVGASPTSFTSLSLDQRCGLLKSLMAIHRLGVIHNDLAASNIAISDSTAIILDFGQSETGHVCPGADLCPELVEGAAALGVDPTDVI